MKHAHTLLGAALAVAFTTAAIAAEQPAAAPGSNKADKTQVMPPRSDLQPGAAPTLQRMDENAQRQHSRDAAAGNPKTGTPPSTPPVAAGGTQVRDWGAIDKNRDNLVSPEEMEAYLQQSRPAAPAAPAAPKS